MAAAGVCVLAAAPAQAGVLVADAPSCEQQVLENPFMRWLDPAAYTLVSDGTLESGAAGWTLAGGAAVVEGNESYQVHGAEETHSLLLSPGSSATTPVICVGIEHPTLRHFVQRTSGSSLSTLRVEVLFEDSAGHARSLTIGRLSGSGSWQPTPVMVIGASLLPLLPGERTPVAFRFTPEGAADWRIDDVYVDPYGRY